MKSAQPLRNALVALIILILATAPLYGCASSPGGKSGGATSQSEKAEDIVFEDEETGFSARFPSQPYREADDTGITFAAMSPSFPDPPNMTYIWVLDTGLDPEAQERAGKEWQDTLTTLLMGCLSGLPKLKPTSDSASLSYGTLQGCIYAELVEPFTFLDDDSSKVADVYTYGMAISSGDHTYVFYGTRSTEAKAQEALDSFKLL